jgi:hypothetical protein
MWAKMKFTLHLCWILNVSLHPKPLSGFGGNKCRYIGAQTPAPCHVFAWALNAQTVMVQITKSVGHSVLLLISLIIKNV